MGKVIFYLVMIIGLITGWYLNLVNTLDADWKEPYKKEAFAFAGVFVVPLGALNSIVKIGEDREIKLEGVK